MSRPAISIFGFGLYLAAGGLLLVLVPEVVVPLRST